MCILRAYRINGHALPWTFEIDGWFTTTRVICFSFGQEKNNSFKMPIEKGEEHKYKRSIHTSKKGKNQKKEKQLCDPTESKKLYMIDFLFFFG